MTRDRFKDVRRVANLRWLICLAGLPLLAGPAAAADAPQGAGAWRWVGQWWSVPPAGSPVRALVPADPTLWTGGLVLPGSWDAFPPGRADANQVAAGRDALDPWSDMGFRPDGSRRTLGRKTELDWGQINSKVVLSDPSTFDQVVPRSSAWQTAETVRLPVAGPVFLVGQVDSRCDSLQAQLYNLETRTGIGSVVPFLPGGEVQLRGGRTATNYDPDSASLVPGQSQSWLLLEVSARCQLVGPLKLEYVGNTQTALSPATHDKFKQDVRVALPLGDFGQFHVGAKYSREGDASQPVWSERQLYLGLQLNH